MDHRAPAVAGDQGQPAGPAGSSPRPFAGVLQRYHELEADGCDTWNPLQSDRELVHRLLLFDYLCHALRRSQAVISELQVLDVGCGNGRSTRVYLDFGLLPEQLTGIDLRPGAIAMARRCHPGISFQHYPGDRFPVAAASAGWLSLCTVLSSVGAPADREHLVGEVMRALAPGGFLFYFDRRISHRWAGGDNLDPARLFPDLQVVSDEPVHVQGRLERLAVSAVLRRLVLPVVRWLLPPPSHRASLLQRPR